MLALQREPLPLRAGRPSASIGKVLARIRHAGSGQLVLYLVAVQGAVQIAGPFFTPFMFEWLGLSYLGYMILIATAYATKIAMLPAWGSIAHRLGALRLLWIGGAGIVPVSALVDRLRPVRLAPAGPALFGVVWGACDSAATVFWLQVDPEEERTGVLTFYNLGNTTAWVLGSTLGGLVLLSLGTGPLGYLLLFGISSVARAFALLLLRRVPSSAARNPIPSQRSPFGQSPPRSMPRLFALRKCPSARPVPASNPALAAELAPSRPSGRRRSRPATWQRHPDLSCVGRGVRALPRGTTARGPCRLDANRATATRHAGPRPSCIETARRRLPNAPAAALLQGELDLRQVDARLPFMNLE